MLLPMYARNGNALYKKGKGAGSLCLGRGTTELCMAVIDRSSWGRYLQYSRSRADFRVKQLWSNRSEDDLWHFEPTDACGCLFDE